MRVRGRHLIGLAATACLAWAAPAAAQTTTIGADVNQAFNYTGACTSMMAIPCTVVNRVTTPARTMAAPCDGTVVRFRLNGTATANTYRIRIVHDNQNGTYTPVGTSSPPVTLTAPGVTEFPASVPIKAGEYVGIDFTGATVVGLQGFGGPGYLEDVFFTFPSDGTPDTPFPDSAIYLYNADVQCSQPAVSPPLVPVAGQPPAVPAAKCKKPKKKKGAGKAASAAKKKKGCKKRGKKK